MADDANAPPTVDGIHAVEDTPRPADAVTNPVSTEAKPAADEGLDVTSGEGVQDLKLSSATDALANPTKSGDASTDNTKTEDDTAQAPAANGTPASSQKANSNNNNRRKSGAGIPEHKKKTPKGKKLAPELHLNAQPGEVWFVAMRGYPPWPVIICDEEMLPEALLSKRPVSAQRMDGTYREDFREGGKNAKDRRYPVMFLGTNEFAWQVNTELNPLDLDEVKKEVESGNSQKKTKALWDAYQIAAKGNDLAYFKELLDSHEQAMQIDLEKKEAKQEKKDKAKRKSAVAEESEDAEMEDANDDGASAKKATKASKKRKKNAESDGETEKPVKTPKITQKLKINAPKDPSATKSKKDSKPKKAKAKSEDAEVEAEAVKPEEKPLTEAERREKQEKSVLYLRHRLQKGFLSRDQAPKEEEMSNMSDYLKQLEQTDNLDAEVIKKTKVHKVLKAIVKLPFIPKEEEYTFKKRSTDLLQAWSGSLTDGEVGEASGAITEPTTNGVNHEEKKDDVTKIVEKLEEAAQPEAVKATDGDGDVSMADATDRASSKADPSSSAQGAADVAPVEATAA